MFGTHISELLVLAATLVELACAIQSPSISLTSTIAPPGSTIELSPSTVETSPPTVETNPSDVELGPSTTTSWPLTVELSPSIVEINPSNVELGPSTVELPVWRAPTESSAIQAVSSCAVQYDAWSASSVSYSYNAYIASRKIKNNNPFTAPPIFPEPQPSCCESFDTKNIVPRLLPVQVSTSGVSKIYPPCGHNCDKCDVQAAVAFVWYWQTSAQAPEKAGSTVTQIEQKPVSIVYGPGTTFISPTAYLHIDSIFADNALGLHVKTSFGPCSSKRLGGTYTDLLYPIPPGQSLDKMYDSSAIEPLDYTRDLRGPSNTICGTASGSTATAECITEAKLEICLDWVLVPPLILHDIDPAWANCSFTIPGCGNSRPPHILGPEEPLQMPAPILTKVLPATTEQPAVVSRKTLFSPPTPTPKGVSLDPSTDSNTPPGRGDDEEIEGKPSPSQNNPQVAVITIGSAVITARPGELAPPITTLKSGSPAITLSDQVVSMATNGVVVNGVLIAFSTPSAPNERNEAVFTVGSSTFTAYPDGVVLPAALHPGGPVQTISGHVISLATDGVVVDGVLTPFSTLAAQTGPDTGKTRFLDAIMYPFTHGVSNGVSSGVNATTTPRNLGITTGTVTGGTATVTLASVSRGSRTNHDRTEMGLWLLLIALWAVLT